MEVVLGMDFGGTKIALAVCDLDGRCLAQQVLATSRTGGRPSWTGAFLPARRSERPQ